ncbi:putative lightoid family protein [Paratrimastix pyriformis]|uniref:Lightoid family protein n=1 Tax=Paratrimastix pyriformis TaxID=342808 RepID=A0ABQ8UUV2_9EUKA|nr:putative lightoid family protein [Paratrimastix pyriformis]
MDSPPAQNEAEDVYKVIVVGDSGTGKTSVIQRYVSDVFSDSYKATIGVDFLAKRITVQGRKIQLRLWDIAGQERYGYMTRVYFRDAIGALVVFDVNNPKSLEGARKWKADIDGLVPLHEGALSNISPQQTRSPSRDTRNDRFLWYSSPTSFPTSAKTNRNVTEGFTRLLEEIMATSDALRGTAASKQPAARGGRHSPATARPSGAASTWTGPSPT